MPLPPPPPPLLPAKVVPDRTSGPSPPKKLILTQIKKKFINPTAKINRINVIRPFHSDQRPNVTGMKLLNAVVIKEKPCDNTTNDQNRKIIAQTTIKKLTPANLATPLKPYPIHCCSKCGTTLDEFPEFAKRLKGMASNVHFNFKCRMCALRTTRWQRHLAFLLPNPREATTAANSSTLPATNSDNVCTKYAKHFLNADDLQTHNSVRHAAKKKRLRIVCSLCDAKYLRYAEVYEHVMREHADEYADLFERVCSLCTTPVECKTREELELHYTELHTHFDDRKDERRLYTCEFCTLVDVTTLADAIAHRSRHHIYRCPHCPKRRYTKLETFDQWKAHTLLKHLNDNASNYGCLICGQIFLTRPQYKRHEKETHLNVTGLYQCKVCEYSCRRISQYRRHIYAKHEHLVSSLLSTAVTNMCEICGECFTNLRSMLCHRINMHKPGRLKRTYDCDICRKRFLYRNPLKRHLITHTDSRPLKCDLCSNTYRDATDLRRHKRVHGIGEKKIECTLCDKRFYEGKELRHHVRIHH